MKRNAWLGVGVGAVLVGLGFVFPAVAQWRDQGFIAAVGIALLGLGVLVAGGGVGAVVLGLRAARA